MSTQTATYQSYDSYKDSQVPWCPQVPSSWDLVPNKGLLHKKKDVVGPNWDQYTLLSLTKQGVIVRDMENISGKFSEDMSSYQRVKPGELIFCLFDIEETPRTVGLSADDGMITGAYTVFSCKSKTLAEFLELYYIAMDDGKRLSYMYSGLRNTIRPPVFLSLQTPLPSEEEMERIINFVKAKTAIIDKLINKKQKLIKLFQEKRQTLITQAVTKGLDPNAEMKDSGVEWIGEVPEGWEVSKYKHCFHFINGNGFPIEIQGKEDGNYPFYKVGDLGLVQVYLKKAQNYVDSHEIYLYSWTVIPKKSLITAKIGAALGVNHRKINLDDCLIDNNMLALVPNPRVNLKYQYYLSMVLNFDSYSNPGAVPSVNMKLIKNETILVPPSNEQNDIVNYLDKFTSQTDIILSKVKNQLNSFQEFKSALIYNAVTGKIKV